MDERVEARVKPGGWEDGEVSRVFVVLSLEV